MVEKAPMSMCIIVKNEPLLEQCILSFRDYVEELVIVDTGSTDNTAEIAQKYADVFESFQECNNPETGLIEDFSQARQRSFDLASKDWVAWVDGDDVIVGAEKFSELIARANASAIGDCFGYCLPYEYAYNSDGECILNHYRERLLYKKSSFNWVNPVHEVIIPKEDRQGTFLPNDEIVYKHQRQKSNKAIEPNRNLRILRKYYEKVGDSDARQLYYLGLEYANAGMITESIDSLIKYVHLSGWDDERVMACLKLIDIYTNLNQLDDAIKWSFKAIEIKEDWAEGYFALAKLFYYKAMNGGANEFRNWQKCVYFAKIGLKLPPTKTLLFINPLERSLEIHKYLNVALNKIGDVESALESVNTGLLKDPNEGALLCNKRIYEEFLARKKIIESTQILRKTGTIDSIKEGSIIKLIHNEPISFKCDKFHFSSEIDLHTPPDNLPSDNVNSMVVFLWKQFVLHNDFAGALDFLKSLPSSIFEQDVIEGIIKTTEDFLSQFNQPVPKLNIVFYAGPGVEVWNPDTIAKNGIGGSELMMFHQAKNLAKLGHQVRVYNSCGEAKTYDGVDYLPSEEYQNLICDVLIVSRRADALDDHFNITAKLKLLWVHDVFAINATNERLLKADRILALTNWHKDLLISHHDLHPDHVIVTRNGIDLSRFNKEIKRNPYKCVNSSSPDRSWPVLLSIWPAIKSRVPEAELHLYYGFKNWEFSAQNDPKQLDLIQRLKLEIQKLEGQGVVFHDRINQEQLAEEYLSAGVQLYPTWFSETSNIGGMEAQAAGLKIVTSNIAALKETVGSRGILLDGDWASVSYQQQFIDKAVEALTQTTDLERSRLQNYARNNFCLESLAKDWEKMFFKLLQRKAIHPVISYNPTQSYR